MGALNQGSALNPRTLNPGTTVYTIRMITKSCVSDFFLQPVLTQPTRVECPLRRRCLANNFHPNLIHSTHAPITSTSTSNCLMGVGGGVMVTMVPWPGPEPPPTSTPQPSMPLQGCQGLESRLTTSYSEVGTKRKLHIFYQPYSNMPMG